MSDSPHSRVWHTCLNEQLAIEEVPYPQRRRLPDTVARHLVDYWSIAAGDIRCTMDLLSSALDTDTRTGRSVTFSTGRTGLVHANTPDVRCLS